MPKTKTPPQRKIDEAAILEAIKDNKTFKEVRELIRTQLDYKPTYFLWQVMYDETLIKVAEYYSSFVLNYFLKNSGDGGISYSLLQANQDKNSLLQLIIRQHTIEELKMLLETMPSRKQFNCNYHSAMVFLNSEKECAIDVLPRYQKDGVFCQYFFSRYRFAVREILDKPELLKLYFQTYDFKTQVYLLNQLSCFSSSRRKIKAAMKQDPEILKILKSIDDNLTKEQQCNVKHFLYWILPEEKATTPKQSRFTFFGRSKGEAYRVPDTSKKLQTGSNP